jgi:capsular exopolysaccharide synthesis family protein
MDHQTPHQPQEHSSGLHEYLAVVKRRKWVALATILIVTGAAFALSHLQHAEYRASAEVLLSRNLASALSNVTDPNQSISPDRLAQTQADLAQVPTVIENTLKAAHVTNMTPGQFAAASSVAAKSDADLLVFRFDSHDPKLAARLATAYAQQYILYRKQLDTQALTRARSQVKRRLAQLEQSGDRKSAVYANLVERDQQLATLEALQTSNSTLVKAARGAGQTQPRPTRNTVLGFLLGILLGLALAFLRDALDTRVRSADEVSKTLRLPLLARLPAPPKTLSSADKLVMIAEPTSPKAEPFRMLRTNLEFVNLKRQARKVIVTSAVEGEGKSTTAANLALALSLAGQHVVLVDLDLRRPYLHRFFGIEGSHNLAEVALGHVSLDDAIVPVTITNGLANGDGAAAGNGAGKATGVLEVLATGPVPPNPGEFSGSPIVGEILEQLSWRAQYVIIDTAPLLSVGDTLALSRSADAMILVARLKRLRKPMLKELGRMLDGLPGEVLGFVVTEAEAEDEYAYGYGYRYGYGYGEGRRRGSGQETVEPAAHEAQQ